MQRQPRKSTKPNGRANREPLRQLIDDLVARPRKQRWRVVYKLLCSLLGEQPEGETWIWDPKGLGYGCFLSPGRWLQFYLLEHPGFEEELDRRSKDPSECKPHKDIMKRVQAANK